MSRLLWSILLLFSILGHNFSEAKRSSGGGRGSSGARSSSSFSSGSRSSGSSFSSSGSSYSRPSTGTSSYRSGNTQYNSNFRQNVFHSSTTSTTFMYSPMTHTNVIISPITPIYFGSYHYYWGGHYVHTNERPQMCEYSITEDDQELRNVTFSNGTKPTTLTFGCRSSESCCGLECCTSSSTWITIVVIIVGIVCMIMVCSWCSKKGYCQNETIVTSGVPVIATTTTTHTFTTQNAPPPPPGFQGFQQYGPPPSAPVFQAPPAYNNYEQNSPYGGRPISSGQIQTYYKN
ncbi:hypothetical protein CAEBREN_08868 [Caenorhabditis brenneri]|uniref:CX domain-containing protein n=1 Tax=Caenorhabditis brenneri TaxID=135651 RepID=G0NTY9_CAEBE|nr:hypothetical protein CAEBREN_08868 [Caenorhabditis brenneri]